MKKQLLRKEGRTRLLLRWHRWAGLLLSVNLLLFCLSGLVLLFRTELEQFELGSSQEPIDHAGSGLPLQQSLDRLLREHPDQRPVYLSRDPRNHELGFLGLTKTRLRLAEAHPFRVNLSRAEYLARDEASHSLVGTIHQLHAELLLGPRGGLLVGLLGLALLVLLTTGLWIYAPLMKRRPLNPLRRRLSRRAWSAELHKFMGVSSFAWLFVVVASGVLLSAGSLLIRFYAQHELAAYAEPFLDEPLVTSLDGLEQAMATAERETGKETEIILFPGSDFASPQHYALLLSGGSGIEAGVFDLALVHAEDTTQIQTLRLPWYLRSLLIGESLHFGDYGGTPLRTLWVAFTLLTLALSITGVRAFFTRLRSTQSRSKLRGRE